MPSWICVYIPLSKKFKKKYSSMIHSLILPIFIFYENGIVLCGLFCYLIFPHQTFCLWDSSLVSHIDLLHSFSLLWITQVLKGNDFNRVVIFKLHVTHSETFTVTRYVCVHPCACSQTHTYTETRTHTFLPPHTWNRSFVRQCYPLNFGI